MINNKKRKVLAGMTIPAITLAIASGVSLFATSCSKKHPDEPIEHKDFIITFDAGNGQILEGPKQQEVYAGTHFDEVDKPVVGSNGKVFTGWVDQYGKPVMGRQTIHKNMHLTATYGEPTGEYAMITFSAGGTGATLQGNMSVAVNKGYFFFMINRPSVKHSTKRFKNWVYSSGSKVGSVVQENDVITEDVTLVCELTNSYTFTWNGNGATKSRGVEQVSVEDGTLFKNINSPSYTYDQPDYVFEGWYKEQECNNQWLPDDEIHENTTAYAKWRPITTEERCLVTYTQLPDSPEAPIFAPGQLQSISRTATWSTVFKPTVTTSSGNYIADPTGWKYSTDEGSTWLSITDETIFNYSAVRIAPTLVPNVESVHIYGETSAMTEKTVRYNAYVVGCQTQDVVWRAYTDPSCVEESTLVHFDSEISGKMTVDFTTIENQTVYIRATSTFGTSHFESNILPVSIKLPYQDSSKYWYHDETNWYSFEESDLTSLILRSYPTTKLSDGTVSTIDKTQTFENKIFIGRNITTIPNNFMIGFVGFNGEFDFTETSENSRNNVVTIQDSFLEECSSFNKTLDLSHVNWIGDNFLFGCTRFNNGSDGSTDIPLSLESGTLISIGGDFLGNCFNFNQQIKLPISGVLLQIGEFFLFNCVRFNSPLNLPITLRYVNPFFMLNCNSFASTITVNCTSINVFVGNDQQICATSAQWTDPLDPTQTYDSEIYTTGYVVDGSLQEAFKLRFPDSSSELVYRTNRT